ncbi:MAG: shikimate kinase [Gemmataceae bacterium]|nr:shikimate kinase [Gemmataceae bacterium]
MTRAPIIFLIGYRGTGKSATARALAARLAWSWCDADELLEERFGKTIRQIFDDEGEAGFRDKEAAVLDELAGRRCWVIATGGGVVLRPENRAKLRTGVTVWLTAAPATIWERLQADATTAERRPNLAQGGLAEIEELLRLRQPLYEACADWMIDTTEQLPEHVAERIAAWLQGQGDPNIP